MAQFRRRYVDVVVRFNTQGRVVPTEIIWDRNHRFRIDAVIDIRQRSARRAGSQGDCYTVQIVCGDRLETRELFFERSAALAGTTLGRWFVEAREPADS